MIKYSMDCYVKTEHWLLTVHSMNCYRVLWKSAIIFRLHKAYLYLQSELWARSKKLIFF